MLFNVEWLICEDEFNGLYSWVVVFLIVDIGFDNVGIWIIYVDGSVIWICIIYVFGVLGFGFIYDVFYLLFGSIFELLGLEEM